MVFGKQLQLMLIQPWIRFSWIDLTQPKVGGANQLKEHPGRIRLAESILLALNNKPIDLNGTWRH